ncbi:HepT-like ribonuclease domain-containing protein [Candidatus Rariloculus sp.]
MLIHGYASVLPERVWDYAENHLPQLRETVQALLAELASLEP